MDVLNLTHSPENCLNFGCFGRSSQLGRRPCRRRVTDECQLLPRGHRQHRATQRQVSNQASDEQGLLAKSAMQVAEYEHQCQKRCSNGRVAGDGDW